MGIYTEPKKQNNIKESESKSLKMGILSLKMGIYTEPKKTKQYQRVRVKITENGYTVAENGYIY